MPTPCPVHTQQEIGQDQSDSPPPLYTDLFHGADLPHHEGAHPDENEPSENPPNTNQQGMTRMYTIATKTGWLLRRILLGAYTYPPFQFRYYTHWVRLVPLLLALHLKLSSSVQFEQVHAASKAWNCWFSNYSPPCRSVTSILKAVLASIDMYFLTCLYILWQDRPVRNRI